MLLLHVRVNCFVFLILAQFPQGKGPHAGMRDINARWPAQKKCLDGKENMRQVVFACASSHPMPLLAFGNPAKPISKHAYVHTTRERRPPCGSMLRKKGKVNGALTKQANDPPKASSRAVFGRQPRGEAGNHKMQSSHFVEE